MTTVNDYRVMQADGYAHRGFVSAAERPNHVESRDRGGTGPLLRVLVTMAFVLY